MNRDNTISSTTIKITEGFTPSGPYVSLEDLDKALAVKDRRIQELEAHLKKWRDTNACDCHSMAMHHWHICSMHIELEKILEMVP